MCNGLSVGVPDNSCECGAELELLGNGGTWTVDTEEQTIVRVDCPEMFVAIRHGHSNSASWAARHNRFLSKDRNASTTPPTYDNNTEAKHANNAMNAVPKIGDGLILSNNTTEHY